MSIIICDIVLSILHYSASRTHHSSALSQHKEESARAWTRGLHSSSKPSSGIDRYFIFAFFADRGAKLACTRALSSARAFLEPRLWFAIGWWAGWWFSCSFLTLTAVLQYVGLIYGYLYPLKNFLRYAADTHNAIFLKKNLFITIHKVKCICRIVNKLAICFSISDRFAIS